MNPRTRNRKNVKHSKSAVLITPADSPSHVRLVPCYLQACLPPRTYHSQNHKRTITLRTALSQPRLRSPDEGCGKTSHYSKRAKAHWLKSIDEWLERHGKFKPVLRGGLALISSKSFVQRKFGRRASVDRPQDQGLAFA